MKKLVILISILGLAMPGAALARGKKKKARPAATAAAKGPLKKGDKVVTLHKTNVLTAAKKKAKVDFSLDEGEHLTVKNVSGDFVEVEDETGTTGWVAKGDVGREGAGGGQDDGDEPDAKDAKAEKEKAEKERKEQEKAEKEAEKERKEQEKREAKEQAERDKREAKERRDRERAEKDKDKDKDKDRDRDPDDNDDEDEDRDRDDHDEDQPAPAAARAGRVQVGARMDVGMLHSGQELSSDGTAITSIRRIELNAPMGRFTVDARWLGGRWSAGVILSGGSTVSGAVQGSGMMDPELSWSYSRLEGGLAADLVLHPKFRIGAMVGYRRVATTIDFNAGLNQASERVSGPVAGIGLVVSHLPAELELAIAADGFLKPAFVQTTGLEDGEGGTLKSMGVGLEVRRALSQHLGAQVGYRYDKTTIDFEGASSTDPSATQGHRDDGQHAFTVGVGYTF